MKNIKLAKELLKIAKSLIANDNNEINELAKLLKSTFKEVDEGAHCWMKMPSGNYFTTQDESEDGKGVLCCYINEKVDSLGYPAGKMLEDLGTVTSESDCLAIAEYAFKCDKEL